MELLAVISVAILIIVGTQNSSNPRPASCDQNQTMPDDDVHKQLKNQGSTTPGKENVSEEYKRKLAELKASS